MRIIGCVLATTHVDRGGGERTCLEASAAGFARHALRAEVGVGNGGRVDVGAVAAEAGDGIEDGRCREGGLSVSVEGPVPVPR